ncbi:MAG: fasciclin domain-containing protein [Cyanobacteria bacterium P01_D01_bin.6]
MTIQAFSARALAIAGVLSFGLTAPAWADGHTAVEMEVEETLSETDLVPAANIAEIVSGVEEFSTLKAALEAAELTEALMGDGPFTVFAPPNEAFDALPDGVLEALLVPENLDLLTDILTYHVIPDSVMSGDLAPGLVETLEGSDLAVAIDDDMATVDDITIVAVDIPATNGVIHVIEGVLVPGEVAEALATRLAEAEEAAVIVEEETVVVEEEVVVEAEEAPAEPIPGLW